VNARKEEEEEEKKEGEECSSWCPANGVKALKATELKATQAYSRHEQSDSASCWDEDFNV